MSSTETLLTTEQYAQLPDDGRPTELVRGRIITMNLPYPRHGQICLRVGHILASFMEEHDLGHVLSNDSGVITERDPDTVRGPDVANYSYGRVPKGPLPTAYLQVVPELVFEVLSPSDVWSKLLGKVTEYLDAGVTVVCVLDENTEQAHLYYRDRPPEVLTADKELKFPELLGELRVKVRRFFE